MYKNVQHQKNAAITIVNYTCSFAATVLIMLSLAPSYDCHQVSKTLSPEYKPSSFT